MGALSAFDSCSYVTFGPAAAVEEQPQMRVSSLPPMKNLKDKLYQKNEKLYKSFGMFDLNKVGSVTTAEFAKTVEDLNVSFPLPIAT